MKMHDYIQTEEADTQKAAQVFHAGTETILYMEKKTAKAHIKTIAVYENGRLNYAKGSKEGKI